MADGRKWKTGVRSNVRFTTGSFLVVQFDSVNDRSWHLAARLLRTYGSTVTGPTDKVTDANTVLHELKISECASIT